MNSELAEWDRFTVVAWSSWMSADELFGSLPQAAGEIGIVRELVQTRSGLALDVELPGLPVPPRVPSASQTSWSAPFSGEVPTTARKMRFEERNHQRARGLGAEVRPDDAGIEHGG